MYTPDERERLRAELLADAREDARLTGAAITGSASAGREDAWSDIDLAFGVRSAGELPSALADWSARMYERHAALHHIDLIRGNWTYRVFLLPSTLQVDLAFVPADEFGARAPTFRLVFGDAIEPRHVPPPKPEELIGWGWLYALHARSSIARRKLWSAEYMVSGMRDQVLALACLRHGLPAVNARGIDALPSDVVGPAERALVRQIELVELRRAFAAAADALATEIRLVDDALAERLRPAITALVDTAI